MKEIFQAWKCPYCDEIYYEHNDGYCSSCKVRDILEEIYLDENYEEVIL